MSKQNDICNCPDEKRVETYDTPDGRTVTRCIECGRVRVDGSTTEPAPEVLVADIPAADLQANLAATATASEAAEKLSEARAVGSAPTTPDGVELPWDDVADLGVREIADRLRDADQAIYDRLLAWERLQPKTRQTVLDLAQRGAQAA